MNKKASPKDLRIACTPKSLPSNVQEKAALHARTINPVNHPPIERLSGLMHGFVPKPAYIAVLTTRYWGPKGVTLTVGFLDNPPSDLRKHILLHMNAWSAFANVKFTETKTDPRVRITRMSGQNGGYWSYLGTDIDGIRKKDPTMNLEGFTMNTPEKEFIRVVRHETGHTIGCPHEHMRKELVQKIDREAAIRYFGQTQGWSREQVIQQVLTPLEESSLLGTARSDSKSIMCYQIPGSITKSGEPILGGNDISTLDRTFIASIYPKSTKNRASKKKMPLKAKSKK